MSIITTVLRGVGGGYDNLANWPSVANRPSLSGTTLTWIGPVGGGASTSNDVIQNVTLTPFVGSFASSSNNQVIEGRDISLGMVITHTGVTIRRCRIKNGVVADSSFVCIQCNNRTGPTIIEDCIIDGTGSRQLEGISQDPSGSPFAFAPNNVFMRRCNLIQFENHFASSNTNCDIRDNWFHAASGNDCDMVENSGRSDSVWIQHNTFDGRDPNNVDPYPQPGGTTFQNSAVKCTNDFNDVVTNITILNNAFLSMPNVGINDDDSHSANLVSFSVVNNGFYSMTPSQYKRGSTSTILANSGNFVMVNPADVTGALVNGTGQI